ncbi:hypothetical protein AB0395_04555 [Streptosporangium sp. NPDC051023]|uniref:hypothetical protein n=1 Tax=Streptosporangium sp. NPDC051023 TaxID=3155410 RepID=UPI00344B7114
MRTPKRHVMTPEQKEQLAELKQAHPGWIVSYDDGIRVWNAFRRKIPDRQEREAGIDFLIKAPTAERLDEELVRQAEILAALPAPPPRPTVPRTFLRP